MKYAKAAKRYVKAVFELARTQNQLDSLAKDMQAAAQIFNEHPELGKFLANPMVAQTAKTAAVKKIFGKGFSPLFGRLIDLLAGRKRLELLPDVAELFNQHYKKYQGIVEADVTVAVPVDEKMKETFAQKVKEISGKENIELRFHVDPGIIGGYIIQIDDLRVDDSVRGKLRKIKQKLNV